MASIALIPRTSGSHREKRPAWIRSSACFWRWRGRPSNTRASHRTALAGTQTGVFLGIATLDYASLLMQGGATSLDLYSSSGGSHAVAAGRLSYILGLHGPALSVDTACSSSLVATHLACQSLRAGECETALVGGVNVICAPETTLMLSRARMMAPDGRCKTFDERADGFVRGEGCGVLVLRRLSTAQAAGDRILAVIRGSAVNQDGRSSGLTAPNGPAQEAVIRAALANAGLSPADVGYVEAHGTGTPLGDPIELRALGATYGAGRSPDQALVTSSVKTNFGHLEAAAGVAGMAKAILTLQRERIAAHLHVQTPTSHVDWSSLGVRLPAAGGEAWRRSATPRRAAVSSFGFSGTNAHVILEEAPLGAASLAPARAPVQHALPLSARTTAAARELAQRYADFLEAHPESRWPDVCDAAAVGRSQWRGSRTVVLAPRASDAVEALRRFASATGAPQHEAVGAATVLAAEEVAGSPAEVAFVFTGQGGAHHGMGRALYEDAPAFRAAIESQEAAFQRHVGESLVGVLYGDSGAAFDRPEVSASALVAFQVALASLWRSWGVEPASVAGHSMGEYAAAVTAGALSADDAIRMVAARGRAVGALPTHEGAMAIVDASADAIAQITGRAIGAPSPLEIAATNAPEQVVLTGPTADIEDAERSLVAHGVRVRRLGGVSHAYHSAQLDAVLPAYREVCAASAHRAPTIEWVSCLHGTPHAAGVAVDAQYWIDQMRRPVQWRHVVQTLASRGARVLIEIGPTAVLSGLSRASLEAIDVATAVSVPSMRAGVDNWTTMLDALGRGWVRGMSVDWSSFRQGSGTRPVLPTYPFQRDRYWLSPSRGRARAAAPASRHGLLGPRHDGPVAVYDIPIGSDAPVAARDHVVAGHALFAGSAFLDVALSACADAIGEGHTALKDIRFLAPLVVGHDARDACVSVEARDDGEAAVTLSSRSTEETSHGWSRHARATRERAAPSAPSGRFTEPTVLMASLSEHVTSEQVYAAFAARGVTLGASVRAIQAAWRRPGEVLAQLEVPPSVPSAQQRAALLDGALQALGVAAPTFADPGAAGARMLSRIGRLVVHGNALEATWCHATIVAAGEREPWTGQLRLLDAAGTILVELEDLVLVEPVTADASSTYALEWHPRALPRRAHAATTTDLAAVAADRFVGLMQEHGLARYDAVIPALEVTAREYAHQALAVLGVPIRADALVDGDLSGIVPEHHRLVRRLVTTLATDPQAPLPTRARVDETGEMELLHRCGRALVEVLRGEVDPLHLLFPDGSFTALDRLYRDSAFAHTYNGALRTALASEVASRGGGPVRVLEVGAGTGGTTGFVINVLPEGSEYHFTDLSPLFLERARERFGSDRKLSFRLLDIERNPAAQGFDAEQFDVIVASNVLHATADLAQTLAHVRQLAAPDALLLLLEGTTSLSWVDLTFGLTEGWWRFRDYDVRPTHPLLSAAEWVQVLDRAGFGTATAVQPAGSAPVATATQALIIARAVKPDDATATPLLVFGDEGGIGASMAATVRRSGADAVLVSRPDVTDLPAFAAHEIEAFRARVSQPVAVAYLWAVDVPSGVVDDDEAALPRILTEAVPLAIMRAVAAPDGAPARLWLATRGAQAVCTSDDVRAPEQAPLWGWARGFALEHPGNAGACVDLDPAAAADVSATELLTEILAEVVEDQVGFRGGERRIARLVRRPDAAPTSARPRTDGSYLITGGTGGLGLQVAEWLAQQGAGEIVLLSRSGQPTDPTDPRLVQLSRLAETGCVVHVVAADVADPQAMAAVFQQFGTVWRPLRGIVHAAVQMSSAPIVGLEADQLDSMRHGKIDATRVLHRLSEPHALDFFLLYSSTTALLGVHGLSHYAAANQYLDAMAHYRAARGLPALSISWGTWDVMRVASTEARATFARGGMRPLSSALALEAQHRLLASGTATAVVADIDWSVLVPVYEARRRRPLIHDLAVGTTSAPAITRPGESVVSPLAAMRNAPRSERPDLLSRLVRQEVAAVLGYGSNDGIPVDRGFFELGLDSLMSVELKRRLETVVGVPLPSTLTFNYPTISAIAGFLEETLFAADESEGRREDPAVVVGALLPAIADDASESDLEAALLARLERLGDLEAGLLTSARPGAP